MITTLADLAIWHTEQLTHLNRALDAATAERDRAAPARGGFMAAESRYQMAAQKCERLARRMAVHQQALEVIGNAQGGALAREE